MPDMLQFASWPGVVGVQSCSYTCSHGTTPGRAILTTFPQTAAPLQFGDLTFGDGVRTVTIPGCKVESVSPTDTPDGQIYTLDILDGRWTWGTFGGLNGHYNQKDEHGKLVPWTIRSPKELAAIILAALGIGRGTFHLPDGLRFANAKVIERFLVRGENFPQSFTNPEVIWNRTPPSEALNQLADFYGLRVVYQPNLRAVSLLTPGRGRVLPNLPAEIIGGSLKQPPAPAYVGAFGQPVKIQARFRLEAVGEEWDGTYVPINLLSYAPVCAPDRPQITEVRYIDASGGLRLTLSFVDPKTGRNETHTVTSTAPMGPDHLNNIRFDLIGIPAVQKNFVLTINPGHTQLSLKGRSAFAFSVTIANPSGSQHNSYAIYEIQACRDPRFGSWNRSKPPEFTEVQPTERLSYAEARALAVKSVFRCYRIVNVDPHDMNKFPGVKMRPINLPWWGKIKRRQQILLQDTKVEEVVPIPRIPGAINKANQQVAAAAGLQGAAGQGVIPEFYNGYSRFRANTVTGSVFNKIGYADWLFVVAPGADPTKPQFNTEETDRVFVDFAVNQKEQMIVFSEPVYRYVSAGGYPESHEPVLTLEAGCFVLHPDTNAVVRWEEVLRVPGGFAQTEWVHREDINVGVIGKYGPTHALLGFDFDGIADTKARAGYYLRGQAAKYRVTGGETRQYPGIVPHDPDGYTQQVTWSVGAGATTTVSGNTEHNLAIPPYPARRRAENLPANKAAAAANLAERAFLDQAKPKEAK